MSDKLQHLPAEYQFAIASVTVRSAQLDHHVEKVIDLALRNQPKTAAFALKNLGADRVVGLMKAVLLDAFPDEEEPIENLLSLINRVRSERNEIIHWLWGHDVLDDGSMPILRHRPHRESEMKFKSAERTHQLADDIHDAIRALLEWQGHLSRRIREA